MSNGTDVGQHERIRDGLSRNLDAANLKDDVEDVCYARGNQASRSLRTGDLIPKRLGSCRRRSTVTQLVENNIGIEDDPDSILSGISLRGSGQRILENPLDSRNSSKDPSTG